MILIPMGSDGDAGYVGNCVTAWVGLAFPIIFAFALQYRYLCGLTQSSTRAVSRTGTRVGIDMHCIALPLCED